MKVVFSVISLRDGCRQGVPVSMTAAYTVWGLGSSSVLGANWGEQGRAPTCVDRAAPANSVHPGSAPILWAEHTHWAASGRLLGGNNSFWASRVNFRWAEVRAAQVWGNNHQHTNSYHRRHCAFSLRLLFACHQKPFLGLSWRWSVT